MSHQKNLLKSAGSPSEQGVLPDDKFLILFKISDSVMAYHKSLFHHWLILAFHYFVIISMSYMYLKVGMTHFYRLALNNLMLCLIDILLKSKLFK